MASFQGRPKWKNRGSECWGLQLGASAGSAQKCRVEIPGEAGAGGSERYLFAVLRRLGGFSAPFSAAERAGRLRFQLRNRLESTTKPLTWPDFEDAQNEFTP